MLVEAVNWRPSRRLSQEQIMATPESAHYVTGWPKPGDHGVIAEADGQPIGAAWLRFFRDDDPGFGFVTADVPELAIAVISRWRGCGVGRAMLRALAEQARSSGIRQISLSVGRENYAHMLYLSEGYRIVDSSDARSDTMLLDL
jgi:GNAT superfamily N-acetyltransferase